MYEEQEQEEDEEAGGGRGLGHMRRSWKCLGEGPGRSPKERNIQHFRSPLATRGFGSATLWREGEGGREEEEPEGRREGVGERGSRSTSRGDDDFFCLYDLAGH